MITTGWSQEEEYTLWYIVKIGDDKKMIGSDDIEVVAE